MANGFFHFKQFTVWQNLCAMKVCQDSCAFGAWADPAGAKSILDIGTGTGLLSLMLAQRTDANITAIEIDAKAVKQAKANVAASPFAERIEILKVPMNKYALDADKRYELIICNPPFYQQHLKPEQHNKQVAHHDDGTFLSQLVVAAVLLMKPAGKLMVMYPPNQSLIFQEVAGAIELKLHHRTVVYDRPGKAAIRHFDEYTFTSTSEVTDELFFKDIDGQLSNQFKELMQEYYLDK